MKVVVGVAAAIVLAGLVLAASAKLDQPSKSESVARVIEASREDVWAALADLDAYSDWNPYITRASGDIRAGGELRLRLQASGGDAEDATVKVITAHFERKLRWEDRLVLPGIRDLEVTFKVTKLTPERVRLVETVRMEGFLAPFANLEPTTRGLEQMAAALERRVEANT
jgi:hypothetical protein